MTIYLPSLLDKFKDFVNGLKANWEEVEGRIIEESGSNSHGRYTRFADGLQICTGEFTLPSVNQTWGTIYMVAHDSRPTVTFPKQFKTGEVPCVSCSPKTPGGLLIPAAMDISATNFVGNAARGTMLNDPWDFIYVAIGVWK